MLSLPHFVLRTLIQYVPHPPVTEQLSYMWRRLPLQKLSGLTVSTVPHEMGPLSLHYLGSCSRQLVQPRDIQIEALYAVAGVYSDHMIFSSIKSVGTSTSELLSRSSGVLKGREQSPTDPQQRTQNVSEKSLFL